MFIISKDENKIHKVQAKTFSELKFKEREHLQEWIEGNPEALGEELLIIQKEFSGFSDTNERLDLRALDKQGNIVVIENKLEWERLDDKCASRIKYENTKFNIFDKDCWEEMVNFMVDAMVRMERSLKTPIKKVAPKLKNFEKDISNDNKDTLTPIHS